MKEGWKKVKLMDNCSVTTGKNDANHAVDNGRYRFYTCASEYLYCNTYKYDGACIILPGNGANVGDVYFYEGKFDAYQRTYVIDNISPKVLPFYLYYQLQYGWKTYGVAKQYGSATNYIKIGNFKDYEFLCPNIDTQKEIVEYLDSSFAKIDKLKENAAKNLEEAKALFQSALKDALEPKEGWEEKTLEYVATDMYRGSGIKRDQVTEEGISCVRYGEIYTTYNFYFDVCKSHTNEGIITSKKYFENGDILFAITGESVEEIGKSIAYLGKEKCLAGGDIVVMKHNQNPKFLSYALSTPNAIKQKGYGKTKLKVVHTNIPSLKTIKIPIPSIQEQIKIAEFLDSLNEKVNTLQQNYSRICDECDALKQAILRQVFE